jgi:putative membrane protein
MFHDFGWGFMGFGLLFWIAVVVLIVVLVVQLANRASNSGSGAQYPQKQETALDILKKRYAKGEISKEEFEEKKKDIE